MTTSANFCPFCGEAKNTKKAYVSWATITLLAAGEIATESFDLEQYNCYKCNRSFWTEKE